MAVRPQHGPQPGAGHAPRPRSPAAWAASGRGHRQRPQRPPTAPRHEPRALTMHHPCPMVPGRTTGAALEFADLLRQPAQLTPRAESTTPAAATRPPSIVSASRFAHTTPITVPTTSSTAAAWSRALSQSVSISASDPVLNRLKIPNPMAAASDRHPTQLSPASGPAPCGSPRPILCIPVIASSWTLSCRARAASSASTRPCPRPARRWRR